MTSTSWFKIYLLIIIFSISFRELTKWCHSLANGSDKSSSQLSFINQSFCRNIFTFQITDPISQNWSYSFAIDDKTCSFSIHILLVYRYLEDELVFIRPLDKFPRLWLYLLNLEQMTVHLEFAHHQWVFHNSNAISEESCLKHFNKVIL